MELNPEQRKAVEETEGYVRVIAGAGSGKTRALSSRFAYLVNELGILPSSILCVTFTNKSAAEMKKRIRTQCPDMDGGYISTFHGFCHTVLQEESHFFHFPKSFMVLDNADIDQILAQVYEERKLSSRHMTFSAARDMIEIKKIDQIPDYYSSFVSLSLQEVRNRYDQAKAVDEIIFYGYLYHQKKNYALDYNDLIILTLYVFENDVETARKWQERLEYIMIDEFQDIDDLQYRLMRVLQRFHKNLFVVGDPDQTIYTWRGANVRYLLDFDKEFVPAKTIMMNRNYRSTPQILDAANHLIDHNQTRIKKDLIAMSLDGPRVRAMHLSTQKQEALAIVSTIEHLLHKGYRYQDIVILYRAHYLSRILEETFIEKKIPYTIYSGIQFFQRKEIKDVLAYLRMLVYHDDLDLLRTINTPKRNIGKTRIEALKLLAAEQGITLYEALQRLVNEPKFQNTKAREYLDLIENYDMADKPVTRIIAEILERSGYEKDLRLQGAQERLDNLAELKQAAADYEQNAGEDVSLDDFLNHLALFTSADQELAQDKVRMMTIHTAKGLEFPCVLMTGMSENQFPSAKTKNLQGMEEERRLCFVALTRAKNELYLFDSEGQLIQGGFRYPSRFLFDISEEAMIWDPKPDADLIAQSQAFIQARNWMKGQGEEENRFSVGDRVRHKVFGEGTILEINEKQMSCLIHFDKLNTQRRLSWKASLEKIGREHLDQTGFLN